MCVGGWGSAECAPPFCSAPRLVQCAAFESMSPFFFHVEHRTGARANTFKTAFCAHTNACNACFFRPFTGAALYALCSAILACHFKMVSMLCCVIAIFACSLPLLRSRAQSCVFPVLCCCNGVSKLDAKLHASAFCTLRSPMMAHAEARGRSWKEEPCLPPSLSPLLRFAIACCRLLLCSLPALQCSALLSKWRAACDRSPCCAVLSLLLPCCAPSCCALSEWRASWTPRKRLGGHNCASQRTGVLHSCGQTNRQTNGHFAEMAFEI